MTMRFRLSPVVFSVAATLSFSLPRSIASNASAFVSSRGFTSVVDSSSPEHKGTSTTTSASSSVNGIMPDPKYPGTAVERMMNVRARVEELAKNESLSGRWEDARRKLLWAGGLRDLPNAIPGNGYTGHSFNDYNHVDLTCMLDQVSDNENDGQVKGIMVGNRLGNGIRVASLPELGRGGSWSTCAMGCNKEPPQDVAHLQFQSRIAFKLVWVPNENFDTFVLVDDDGKLLAHGKPDYSEDLPPLRERQMNYRLVAGSKYAKEADKIARNIATE